MRELIRSIACSICKALSVRDKKPQELVYELVSSKKISLQDLYILIRDKFPGISLWISDNEYTLCHYNDVAYFLAISQIDKLPYEPETFDCDDYSAVLWGEFSKPPWSGLAIGYLWTEVHALNCVVTEDLKFLFLEPQTDELSEQLAPWQGLQPRLLII